MEQGRAAKLLSKVPGGAEVVAKAGVAVSPTPPASTPPASTPPAAAHSVEAKPEPPASVDTGYDLNPGEATPEPKKVIPPEFVPDDPTDEIDQMVDPKASTGENFKKLRTKLKAVNTDYKRDKAAFEEARARLEAYESGTAVPDIVQSQANRISQLERYEQIFNFKNAPIYVEKYVKPVDDEKGKFAQLLEEYPHVPKDVLDEALKAPTPADTNRILTQAFKDEVGALEAKSIVKTIRKIQSEAAEAEKEPQQSLAMLQKENDELLASRRRKAAEVIMHTSKVGWSESLTDLRSDKRFKEITFQEGNTEHNEKYVRPILTNASQDYGKTVADLAKLGLTELPKELAQKLAKSDILARYSAVLLNERDQMAQELAELRSLVKRRNTINYPSLNGAGGSSSNGGPKLSPGASALSRVGVKM